MSLKEDLPKWVYLSIAKYFTDNVDSDLHVFIEGTESNTSQEGDWAEIRVNGPDIAEVSKSTYRVTCEIDILVATHIDYDLPMQHVENIGKITANFASSISVYKYGGDGGDQLGCLELEPTSNVSDKLTISNLGNIDPSLKLLQTNIVGNYKMTIND